MTVNDITADGHARRYSDVWNVAPELTKKLVKILNSNGQRLADAGTLFQSPALQGVVTEIEPVLETLGLGRSLRARQFVGVAVRIRMAELGYQNTGRKGPVRSKYFKRAEIYQPRK